MTKDQPAAILRKDYRSPDFWIDKVDLEFDNPQEIELRLLALTARRLAEELYGYYD